MIVELPEMDAKVVRIDVTETGLKVTTGDSVEECRHDLDCWVWPEWLIADYIAQDASGSWHAYADRPFKGSHYWYSLRTGGLYMMTELLDFYPPLVSDWSKSLIENPRRGL